MRNSVTQREKDCDLSSRNPLPKSFRDAYEEIRLGRGVPNLDERGNQKIFEWRPENNSNQNNWVGATEWLVPDPKTNSHRILMRILPDGRKQLGYVKNHDYENITLFPGPWYQEGSKK